MFYYSFLFIDFEVEIVEFVGEFGDEIFLKLVEIVGEFVCGFKRIKC